MTSADVKVSLGLPVYNGENYVSQAIESVLNQTHGNLELVISDNASTDGTQDICRAYAAQDDRIKYIRQNENLGASRNYNETFHCSTGTFFKWIAHDDSIEPAYIEKCLAGFDAAPPSAVVCHARTNLIHADGSFYARYADGTLIENSIDAATPHERMVMLIQNMYLCTWVFGLMKRSALEKTRLIDSFVSSDLVLCLELALMGELVRVPDYLENRRCHDESSRKRNRSASELAYWFDTRKKSGVLLPPRLRYGLECVSSIARAELPVTEKAACLGAFARNAVARRVTRRLAAIGLRPSF